MHENERRDLLIPTVHLMMDTWPPRPAARPPDSGTSGPEAGGHHYSGLSHSAARYYDTNKAKKYFKLLKEHKKVKNFVYSKWQVVWTFLKHVSEHRVGWLCREDWVLEKDKQRPDVILPEILMDYKFWRKKTRRVLWLLVKWLRVIQQGCDDWLEHRLLNSSRHWPAIGKFVLGLVFFTIVLYLYLIESMTMFRRPVSRSGVSRLAPSWSASSWQENSSSGGFPTSKELVTVKNIFERMHPI